MKLYVKFVEFSVTLDMFPITFAMRQRPPNGKAGPKPGKWSTFKRVGNLNHRIAIGRVADRLSIILAILWKDGQQLNPFAKSLTTFAFHVRFPFLYGRGTGVPGIRRAAESLGGLSSGM